ncbi:hypothetical protein AZ09_15175 (plasmid) [Acetobacter aceti 1023]|nr:hypothetical protein AZ09_15175 [Acetobacter aceti 1023]
MSLFYTKNNIKTTDFFDPDWYAENYDIEESFFSPLHHYMMNRGDDLYNPNNIFDESFYLKNNKDVFSAIKKGRFVDGYDHYLNYGMYENRAPADGIDVKNIPQKEYVDYLIDEHFFLNYYHFIITVDDKYKNIQNNEYIPKRLFIDTCRETCNEKLKSCIDFSYENPNISVIIVAHNNFEFNVNSLYSLRNTYKEEIQVIFVDSGSFDDTKEIEKHITGMDVIRYHGNVGFVIACNKAITMAVSDTVLLLNNDVEILPQAIQNAFNRLYSQPSIGAVGGKIIKPDGTLQEAGCIFWRQGTTLGYKRGESPSIPEVNFVRDVDFCSGAFLLIRKEVINKIGLFDNNYIPAYYEESDFCIRLHQAGYSIIYDPTVKILHYEYGSSPYKTGKKSLHKNRLFFKQKNSNFLQKKLFASAENELYARDYRENSLKILYIDDTFPLPFLGSGFSRSNEIVNIMSSLGFLVTVFPLNKPKYKYYNIKDFFDDSIELINDVSLHDFENFIKNRANYYDIIWISRRHNMEKIGKSLPKIAPYIRNTKIIFDTECIASIREWKKDNLYNKANEKLTHYIEKNLKSYYIADSIVCVNNFEKWIIKRFLHKEAHILGHCNKIHLTTNTFENRNGILFVGSLHNRASPNYDSMEWFVLKILPIVRKIMGFPVPLTIVGHINDKETLNFCKKDDNIIVKNNVKDLYNYYNTHKVFVAPTRFCSGIPFKVHEAASYGLPVVCTNIIRKQIGWINNQDILSADSEEDFAKCIVQLYNDMDLWNFIRLNSVKRIETENFIDSYKKSLNKIIIDSIKK